MMKILIVDDDPVSVAITRETLEQEGHEVNTHGSGIGTGAQVLRHQPDVVLLDVEMPPLGGEPIARMLARRDRTPAVILHSGKRAKQLQQIAARCSALGGIEKTADSAKFLRRFATLIRQWRESSGLSTAGE